MEPSGASTERKVAVVEDDDGMRAALARLLDAAGYAPVTFVSAEALLADAEEAACVVTDLKLPAMSGLELLSELRTRGGRRPVIVITAHDAPGVHAEALRRGAMAYFVKPVPGTALLNAVKAAVTAHDAA